MPSTVIDRKKTVVFNSEIKSGVTYQQSLQLPVSAGSVHRLRCKGNNWIGSEKLFLVFGLWTSHVMIVKTTPFFGQWLGHEKRSYSTYFWKYLQDMAYFQRLHNTFVIKSRLTPSCGAGSIDHFTPPCQLLPTDWITTSPAYFQIKS